MLSLITSMKLSIHSGFKEKIRATFYCEKNVIQGIEFVISTSWASVKLLKGVAKRIDNDKTNVRLITATASGSLSARQREIHTKK